MAERMRRLRTSGRGKQQRSGATRGAIDMVSRCQWSSQGNGPMMSAVLAKRPGHRAQRACMREREREPGRGNSDSGPQRGTSDRPGQRGGARTACERVRIGGRRDSTEG